MYVVVVWPQAQVIWSALWVTARGLPYLPGMALSWEQHF